CRAWRSSDDRKYRYAEPPESARYATSRPSREIATVLPGPGGTTVPVGGRISYRMAGPPGASARERDVRIATAMPPAPMTHGRTAGKGPPRPGGASCELVRRLVSVVGAARLPASASPNSCAE